MIVSPKDTPPFPEQVELKELSISSTVQDEDLPAYPEGLRLVFIYTSFATTLFLVSLDQTIVSTAIPAIASQFGGLEQVGWIPGAYFLTQASFTLISGQLLTLVSTKLVFLAAIMIFELGSLICAISTSMPYFIVGRAIAGLGASAINPSITAIQVQTTPLDKRPLFSGILGINTALGIILGPLIGGAFTDHVSWRWCFYVNLPFGAVTTMLVLFFIENKSNGTNIRAMRAFFSKVDLIGGLLTIGMAVCLVLSFQWGNVRLPWNSPTIISLLCLSFVLLLLFVFWERFKGPNALVPISSMTNRCQIGSSLQNFFIGIGLYVAVYYLPLWHQIRGSTATASGIDLLPLLLSAIGVSGLTGAFISRIGRYWHITIFLPLFLAIGSGLLFTVTADSAPSRQIIPQIICGIGIGGVLQAAYLPVHAEYFKDQFLLRKGIALTNCFFLFGGLFGVAVANTVFGNLLNKELRIYAPGLSAQVIVALHRSPEFVTTLPTTQKLAVIQAYIASLDRVYLIGVPVGVLASLAALINRNHDLKERTLRRPETEPRDIA